MDARAIINECREMATEIRPELAAHRHYLVDLEDTGLPKENFGGVCIDYMPANVFDLDDWQGGGSVVAINASSFATSLPTRIALARVKAIVCHELAHWNPPAKQDVERLNAIPETRIKASLRRESAIPANSVTGVVQEHGPQFVRRASHLFVRSLMGGHEVRPEDVLQYAWLTPLQFYLPAFMGECIALRFAPMSVVDAEPMPELAKQLHAADAARYHKQETNHASDN